MVNQIERDEWDHGQNVWMIMDKYGIPFSRYLEWKFHIIGKLISISCHFIGRLMPYFLARKLERLNVCESFVMIRRFHTIGITAHNAVLHEMSITEKEHEVYFLQIIYNDLWLPFLNRCSSGGGVRS